MRRLWNSFKIAFAMYSKIPMPRADWEKENMRYMMCFFPLIGAVIGALLIGWEWLSLRLQAGDILRSAGYVLIPVAVTGGIHLDGYADTIDALSSWGDREKKLAILKDSHTGAFAVMACSLYLLLYTAGCTEFTERTAAAVSFGFPLSRSLCGLLISSLPQARETGMLSDLTKETAFFKLRRIMIGSILVFGVLFFMMAGAGSLWIFGVLAVFFCFSRRRFLREFGGITGDLSGLQSHCLLSAVPFLSFPARLQACSN